jgi:hypothetical protein
METFILEDIPYEPDLDELRAELHIQPGTQPARVLEQLAAEARGVAKLEGLYGLAFVNYEDDSVVVVAGVTFKSRVLSVNFDRQNRVFPYVVTGGVELDAWARSQEGILQRYIADMISEYAVEVADEAIEAHIQERYHPGTLSVMNPGSLTDWPIFEQKPLFDLLGDTKAAIGVELTESMMMLPVKSVSGIRFASEHSFLSCQLCPRDACRARRSPYDPGLYEKNYSMKGPAPESACSGKEHRKSGM